MNNLDRLYIRIWTKKRWRNTGDYCNRKTHAAYFPYRKYRRGKDRCVVCGAKIGKVKCVYKSARDLVIDNVLAPSPFLKMLQKRGAIIDGKRQNKREKRQVTK